MKIRVLERKTQNEIHPLLHCSTGSDNKSGSDPKLGPGASFCLPGGRRGPWFWPILCYFSRSIAGTGSEVELKSLGLVALWDSNAAGKELVHYTTAPDT